MDFLVSVSRQQQGLPRLVVQPLARVDQLPRRVIMQTCSGSSRDAIDTMDLAWHDSPLREVSIEELVI